MLIEFTVSNFRSFRDPATLSMLSTHLASKSEEVNRRVRFAMPDGRELLRSAVVYGANASGKSNLLEALYLFRAVVLNSAREGQRGDRVPVAPFRLDEDSPTRPTLFEAVFMAAGTQYRYGFEATPERIVREWLYHRPEKRERELFAREDQDVRFSGVFKEGEGLVTKTRKNALFLSVVAQFNGPLATRLLDWFEGQLRVVTKMHEPNGDGHSMREFTASCLRDPALAVLGERVLNLLRTADLGIDSFDVEERDYIAALPRGMPEELQQVIKRYGPPTWTSVRTRHGVEDAKGTRVGSIDFDLDIEESDGTRKFFALAGPVVDCLIGGRVLAIDELDARLHPLLTRALVGLFHDPEANTKNAQLVFATHDVLLLEPDTFRRDQVWFAEKGRSGATRLSALAEFNGVRDDEAYRLAYLRGKYGAVPSLRHFGEGLHGQEK